MKAENEKPKQKPKSSLSPKKSWNPWNQSERKVKHPP